MYTVIVGDPDEYADAILKVVDKDQAFRHQVHSIEDTSAVLYTQLLMQNGRTSQYNFNELIRYMDYYKGKQVAILAAEHICKNIGHTYANQALLLQETPLSFTPTISQELGHHARGLKRMMKYNRHRPQDMQKKSFDRFYHHGVQIDSKLMRHLSSDKEVVENIDAILRAEVCGIEELQRISSAKVSEIAAVLEKYQEAYFSLVELLSEPYNLLWSAKKKRMESLDLRTAKQLGNDHRIFAESVIVSSVYDRPISITTRDSDFNDLMEMAFDENRAPAFYEYYAKYFPENAFTILLYNISTNSEMIPTVRQRRELCYDGNIMLNIDHDAR